jgi:hypothetical protein
MPVNQLYSNVARVVDKAGYIKAGLRHAPTEYYTTDEGFDFDSYEM